MHTVRRSSLLLTGLLVAPFALALPTAAAPKVVASVKPVHSLVAGVMDDIGEPQLLLEAGQSPHTYSLKPSEAQALEAADLVVWVGPSLEPFLKRAVGNIAQASASFRLIRVDGLTVLRTRVAGAWESRAHEHGHDHDGDAHDRVDTTQGIPENELDPHIWLDPDNAQVLVQAIAARLAEIDPANAEAYHANADATVDRIRDTESSVRDIVAPVANVPYLVFHDAYQYFERHYTLNAVGSITLSPDRQPGARRLLEMRDKIEELGARCVFREPQFAPDLVQTVIEGTDTRVGTLDPLGVHHKAGPSAYPMVMRDMGRSLADCLGKAN